MPKKKKKPYFPNNWQQYKDAPAEWFEPIPVEQFFDWKVAGWELPSSVSCIIREHNQVTCKVKEYTYSRVGDAKNKCRALMNRGESEFIVCTSDAVHVMYPDIVPEYDDPLY